jgi:hypothetical protein
LFLSVLSAATIESLNELNVGNAPIQEGAPHTQALLMAPFGSAPCRVLHFRDILWHWRKLIQQIATTPVTAHAYIFLITCQSLLPIPICYPDDKSTTI